MEDVDAPRVPARRATAGATDHRLAGTPALLGVGVALLAILRRRRPAPSHSACSL